MAGKKEAAPVEIIRPQVAEITVPIIGTSILVTHRWSEKAKQMMREAGSKTVRKKKEPRDPKADFESSLYRSTDGWYGVPAISFKNSAIAACRFVEGLTMVMARCVLFVEPDGFDEAGNALIRIDGDGPHMREDLVRVGMGTADLRYRGYWRKWRTVIRVRANLNVVSDQQVVSLLAIAGEHCGICEGRPTSPKATMDWGLFRIATAEEFEELPEAA